VILTDEAMATRERTRLSTGIYRDRFGIAIVISVQGKPYEFRKDADGNPYALRNLDWLRAERLRLQDNADLQSERDAAKAESLTADVTAYLKTLSGQTRKDAENLLGHWLEAFGDRRRQTLTALELRQYAATWNCAASTFNHRRQALISLFKTLDPPNTPNPARLIPKRKEQLGAPKALSYDVINKVLKAMPESQSRARLKLMAYTGLPQMQITKLTPEDWQGTRLRVTPRRKGSGAAGRWLPLSPEAVLAMQEFTRLKCWGPFSHSSLWKRWRKYGPTGTNPYSLRHSWITELYRRSNGDVLAVKNLALHSMLTQTERYAAAALGDRMAALVVPRNRATKSPPEGSNSLHFVPPKRRQRKRHATATTRRKHAISRGK
jgi:integrase